jgi:alpha-tubulin suppressor-like RCC1 family protein
MASIYDANTNYRIADVDLQANPGFVTREYLIDVYPSLIGTFKSAGLWVWGDNLFGGLGDNTTTDRSSPIQTVSGGANWKDVATGSGGYHTAAIKTDGTLWTWGYNNNGQLGDDTRTNRSSPVQTIAGGTNWKQVSLGDVHTAAIKTDDTLWVWGDGFYGQLGNNLPPTFENRSSPIQTVSGGFNWKLVTCYLRGTAAIKTDGTLWLWGDNSDGQLGDNTTTSKSSPVQTVSGGTNWKELSGGEYHVGAIKTDGTLWVWGSNTYGELGDNTRTSRSSPIQTISSSTDWKQVSCGSNCTAAIKTDGTLWLWGRNLYGGLGDNTTSDRSSPVQTIAGGTNWKQVSTDGAGTAAIKTDGTLWTWGERSTLGDNIGTISANRSSPIQTVAGGTNWKLISLVGIGHAVSIRDNSSDPFRAEPL